MWGQAPDANQWLLEASAEISQKPGSYQGTLGINKSVTDCTGHGGFANLTAT